MIILRVTYIWQYNTVYVIKYRGNFIFYIWLLYDIYLKNKMMIIMKTMM